MRRYPRPIGTPSDYITCENTHESKSRRFNGLPCDNNTTGNGIL